MESANARVMNARTHPAAWQAFTRLTKNRSKWPIKLMPEVKADKQGIFQRWMGCLRDVQTTIQLTTRKMISRETKSKTLFEFKKKRDILGMYGGNVAKVEMFISKLHWIPDENLPDDEEERLYIVRTMQGFSKTEATLETLEAEGRGDIDAQIGAALMGEGGALGDHMSVGIQGMDAKTQLEFTQAMAKAEGFKSRRPSRL